MNRLIAPTLIALSCLVTACPEKKEAAEPEATPEATPEAAPAEAAETGVTFTKDQLSSFGVVPRRLDRKDNPINDAKIELGRKLYYDARLSKNQDVSCNTCHDLQKFGVDPRDAKTSAGHKDQLGPRNSPTVYNAALHFTQFWDGREKTVEDQAKGPPLNPIEMAMEDAAAVEEVLRSIPEYVALFEEAFPGQEEPVTFDNMGMAIGAFERGLMTPSRFDAFLEGDEDALTQEEKKGLQSFMALGCTTCHNGAALGATSFQKLGLIKPWPNQEDLGRFEVTQEETDKMKFKPSSLRNVTRTAPYTHNGEIVSLEEMVRLMARHQLGKQALADEQVQSVIAFLGALEGEIPEDYIAEPELPPSTEKTPKPDPT